MPTDFAYARKYLLEAKDLATAAERGPSNERRPAREEFNRRLHHIRLAVSKVITGQEHRLTPTNADGNFYWPLVHQVLDQAIYAAGEGARVVTALDPTPPGPTLPADALHPAVWDAAKSLWRSEHYREAVRAASVAVNAFLQQKVGRRDIDNTNLIEQAFTTDPAEPTKARLRLWNNDGSDTYRNMQNGAMAFGRGCFLAIRNPGSHEVLPELDQQVALEQLAAFSVLARWIDEATVEQAPSAANWGDADGGVR